MKYRPFLFLLFAFTKVIGQTAPYDERYVKESFVIIMSTKSYSAAKDLATEAAKKLNLKLDLRGLKPNKESGLTFSGKVCEENGWNHPCYVSRGREMEGEWVTIDYSDAFDGFTKGYYIVTTAGGEKAAMKIALQKAKKAYPTAYVKETVVYMGCLH